MGAPLLLLPCNQWRRLLSYLCEFESLSKMKSCLLQVSLPQISCCYSDYCAAFSAVAAEYAEFSQCFGRTCQTSHQKIAGCFPPLSTSCPGTDSNFSHRLSMRRLRKRPLHSATGATTCSSESPESSHRRHCLVERPPSSTCSNSSNSTTEATATTLSNSNRHSYSLRQWPRLL